MVGTESLTTLNAAHIKSLSAAAISFFVVPPQGIGQLNTLVPMSPVASVRTDLLSTPVGFAPNARAHLLPEAGAERTL
jgi:hypothetical protein